MKKLLSIVSLMVALNSSAIVMVSHTSSSGNRHNNGDIQCLNDTTFMYHYHFDSSVDNDTIIYARKAEECLSIAKDYDKRKNYLRIFGIILTGVVLIIIAAIVYGICKLAYR